MTAYQQLQGELASKAHRWVITGVAGFIGSHLLGKLLSLGQHVVGVDDFSTGSRENLAEVQQRAGETWSRFTLQEGNVAERGVCEAACSGADYVLHHAGFVSVPLSIADPIACHDTNVTGTLQVLAAARTQHVQRVVYASSSAVYGDHPEIPNVEERIGRPLSPYAASKHIGELYAKLFSDRYSVDSVGLRYFNIFGPRQNPKGGYAAVIPAWINSLLSGEVCILNGDGGTTRDFCGVGDVVQANLLAAVTSKDSRGGEIYNVGSGQRTTLNELYATLAAEVRTYLGREPASPEHRGERAGDIRHSGADISRITRELGFTPSSGLANALAETVAWFAKDRGAAPAKVREHAGLTYQ